MKEKVLIASCDCDEVVRSATAYTADMLRKEFGDVCEACNCKIEIVEMLVDKEVDDKPINFGSLGGSI